jgi:DNA-binding LacI/PurR family transcriptional regulator
MAFGALMETSERDLRPGVDVSIIGVDDHDAARVVGLSTIAQDVPSQGAAAARSLIAAMSAPGDVERDPEPTVSPIALILRRTTGPARRDAGWS